MDATWADIPEDVQDLILKNLDRKSLLELIKLRQVHPDLALPYLLALSREESLSHISYPHDRILFMLGKGYTLPSLESYIQQGFTWESLDKVIEADINPELVIEAVNQFYDGNKEAKNSSLSNIITYLQNNYDNLPSLNHANNFPYSKKEFYRRLGEEEGLAPLLYLLAWYHIGDPKENSEQPGEEMK